jgi:hypothetical protein
MIAHSRLFLLIGLISAFISTTTCANAGNSGNHGLSGSGQTLRNGGGTPNAGGAKTMSKTNLGGAEREFGKIFVNGAVNSGKMINGSLGAVGRAGAARGHSGCGGAC